MRYNQGGCQVPILMLSAYSHPAYVQDAVAHGAKGYLLKDEYGYTLVTAVKQVALGGTYFSSAIARLIAGFHSSTWQLTQQEIRVLRLVATGASNPEIAHIMGIEGRTVRFHLGNLFQKTGVSNRGKLAAWAWREGFGER